MGQLDANFRNCELSALAEAIGIYLSARGVIVDLGRAFDIVPDGALRVFCSLCFLVFRVASSLSCGGWRSGSWRRETGSTKDLYESLTFLGCLRIATLLCWRLEKQLMELMMGSTNDLEESLTD